MSDSGKIQEQPPRSLTRRQFLKGLSASAGSGILAGCSVNSSDQNPPPENEGPIPVNLPEHLTSGHPGPESFFITDLADTDETKQIINASFSLGLSVRTPEDKAMIDNTFPGIDLTYSTNQAVAFIRNINNPTQRILAAIAFLDVEHSLRYDEKKVKSYGCNVYALDLLRFLLSDQVIGSRYDKNSGEPFVFGINDAKWDDKVAMAAIDSQYPFLSSNNLDWWMETYGETYGWRKIATQVELYQFLANGENVGLGVTPNEKIVNKTIEVGHAFVICGVGPYFGISQATRNLQLELYLQASKQPKVNPENGEYHFWIHKNVF